MTSVLRMASSMTFDEWLHLQRRKQRIRQADLAEALGLSHQTVSSWERGDSIPRLTPPQMRILCEKLDCSFDELVQYFPIPEATAS